MTFDLLVRPNTQVVDIMKTNVEKVLERDQKLSELDDRADALQQGASQFEQQAGKLKRKFWLQNLKVNSIVRRLNAIKLNDKLNRMLWLLPDDDHHGRYWTCYSGNNCV